MIVKLLKDKSKVVADVVVKSKELDHMVDLRVVPAKVSDVVKVASVNDNVI